MRATEAFAREGARLPRGAIAQRRRYGGLRERESLGASDLPPMRHYVRLIPPVYVKSFVKQHPL